MTTVVVTGATGFVGRSVVPLLARRGCTVVTVGRADAAAGPQRVVDRVVEARPDAVIHLATHFLSSHLPSDVPALIRANVEFGTLIAEGATEVCARFVNIGSAWQHVDGADYAPVSLYAASKQALVPILDYYAQASGLDVRTVALFDTYGPGDFRRKLVPSLLRAARDGVALDMSTGDQLIDLTFVDDVARGIVDVALLGAAPTDCVLRSWEPLTIRGLVDQVSAAIGREVPVTWGRRPSRPREMRTDWVFGSSPDGWRPTVTLAEGLQRTWQALLDAGPGA